MRSVVLTALVVVMWVVAVGLAQAKSPEPWRRVEIKPNPFDGWTLEQIKADPGFHPLQSLNAGNADVIKSLWTVPPSWARESAESDAPFAYHWIGYIELPKDYYGRDAVVVFDEAGAGVTLASDYGNPFDDELVPIWFVGTVSYLFGVGFFEGCP